MIGDNTDRSWEKLGRQDPYYGVLTDEKFRSSKLDAGARQEFFASGSVHMAELCSASRRRSDRSPAAERWTSAAALAAWLFP